MGKSKTLNNIYKLAKNETLFFLDADIILNKKAIDEIISRLQNDNIVAVSCPYQTSNPGFIPTMQTLDYNLYSFLQASYNNTSNISLWGGCLVIKKKAFQAVNLFSENMLCEDLELAFKLNKKGWKVQQCFTPVQTYVPKSFRTWYKQKIRWSSGAIQAILTHFKIWLSHPIQIIFLVIFSFLTLCSSIFLIKEILFLNVLWDNYQLINETLSAIASLKTVWLYYGSMILRDLLGRLYFSALTIPYVLPNIKSFKQVYKVLYVIPFSLLYYPALTVISLIGFAKGVRAYHRFKGGQRAW
jgi:cellulose synthase/poly-beta-1,6-N-acetylglucosamine synthase-like glycosyltransferase